MKKTKNKQRNSIACALYTERCFRPKVSKSSTEKSHQKDVWNRKGKHKRKPTDGNDWSASFC